MVVTWFTCCYWDGVIHVCSMFLFSSIFWTWRGVHHFTRKTRPSVTTRWSHRTLEALESDAEISSKGDISSYHEVIINHGLVGKRLVRKRMMLPDCALTHVSEWSHQMASWQFMGSLLGHLGTPDVFLRPKWTLLRHYTVLNFVPKNLLEQLLDGQWVNTSRDGRKVQGSEKRDITWYNLI